MSFKGRYKYISKIIPIFRNARAIVRLTLQDLKAGGFQNALSIADPSNFRMVYRQWLRLVRHPERYAGYKVGGKLVAFIKQNVWNKADEEPFGDGEPVNEWGIFGLVASDALSDNDRDSILDFLLRSSFKTSQGETNRIINIVMHEHDPLIPIALRYGFVPVGETGEAAGAPGLKEVKQQRYQRRVTN